MPDTGLIVASDGFLWYRGAKLPFKYNGGEGFEFFEKDPHRAALLGGPRFVVPFAALESFIDLLKQSERSEA